MRDTELYRAILGLTRPWTVGSVALNEVRRLKDEVRALQITWHWFEVPARKDQQ